MYRLQLFNADGIGVGNGVKEFFIAVLFRERWHQYLLL